MLKLKQNDENANKISGNVTLPLERASDTKWLKAYPFGGCFRSDLCTDDNRPATNIMYLSACPNILFKILNIFSRVLWLLWPVLWSSMKQPGAIYFPKTLIGSCQSFWSVVLVARFGALWSCLVASARTAAAVLQIRASPSPGSERAKPSSNSTKTNTTDEEQPVVTHCTRRELRTFNRLWMRIWERAVQWQDLLTKFNTSVELEGIN